jgi:dTDP-4-amino-4,6-dideoxygalactose transaminase
MSEKPAIAGGKPVSENYIVFGKPEIRDAEINEVIKVLKSGWIGTGPVTKKFEEKFSNYIGCKHAIALNSCTAALHLSLLCNGIGKGDEVIVPPITFAATINVVEHVGAKPVFVDIERESYNISPEKILEAITPNTKAVIPVHLGGLPCDMKEIQNIVHEQNLILIEDAAHAVGAEYNSKKIGSFGNPTCFSFYPTKNITSVEGGMVCLNDDNLAEKIRIFSLHGISKHAWQRFFKEGEKTYRVIYPGYKYNMTDFNAAVALPQLERIDELIKTRKKYAEIYNDEFEDLDLIDLPPQKEGRKSAWHLYSILLRLEKLNISRNKFITALDKENVGSGIHYSAIHDEPFYIEKYGKIKGLTRAEYVSERTVSIPLQTSITEDEVYDVIIAVKRVLNYYRV